MGGVAKCRVGVGITVDSPEAEMSPLVLLDLFSTIVRTGEIAAPAKWAIRTPPVRGHAFMPIVEPPSISDTTTGIPCLIFSTARDVHQGHQVEGRRMVDDDECPLLLPVGRRFFHGPRPSPYRDGRGSPSRSQRGQPPRVSRGENKRQGCPMGNAPSGGFPRRARVSSPHPSDFNRGASRWTKGLSPIQPRRR
jgi:hypothetical protein